MPNVFSDNEIRKSNNVSNGSFQILNDIKSPKNNNYGSLVQNKNEFSEKLNSNDLNEKKTFNLANQFSNRVNFFNIK